MNTHLQALDNTDEELELIETIPPQDLFAFNELRSCADLKRMYDKGQLDLSPDFQREKVWGLPAQTRFLDSLLKNLPIPSMCISQDTESNGRIVIDGLQRISTIVQFLNASEGKIKDFKLSSLEDVDSRLSGKKVSEIVEETPELVEVIENVTIPITVLRSNFSKNDHMEYIFTIFHRLNTGGTRLNAQEIRNCIFSGNFNELLFECAKEFEAELEQLIGTKENKRFTHEEFVLRFFAFHDKAQDYKAPLTRFLNLYMKEHRKLSDDEYHIKKQLFTDVLSLFKQYLNQHKIGAKIIAEAVLYGISQNLSNIHSKKGSDFLNQALLKLLASAPFDSKETSSGTLNTQKVHARLNMAKQIFAE